MSIKNEHSLSIDPELNIKIKTEPIDDVEDNIKSDKAKKTNDVEDNFKGGQKKKADDVDSEYETYIIFVLFLETIKFYFYSLFFYNLL